MASRSATHAASGILDGLSICGLRGFRCWSLAEGEGEDPVVTYLLLTYCPLRQPLCRVHVVDKCPPLSWRTNISPP